MTRMGFLGFFGYVMPYRTKKYYGMILLVNGAKLYSTVLRDTIFMLGSTPFRPEIPPKSAANHPGSPKVLQGRYRSVRNAVVHRHVNRYFWSSTLWNAP